MMAKALIGLAALAAIALMTPQGQAQEWPELRLVQGSSDSSETATETIRRSFRSFTQQAPRFAQSLGGTSNNNVCEISSGMVCTVKGLQPVNSICGCGSARGVISSRSDVCIVPSGRVCSVDLQPLGSSCACGSDEGVVEPRR